MTDTPEAILATARTEQRVARAICSSWLARSFDYHSDHLHGLTDQLWKDFLPDARQAMAAMRDEITDTNPTGTL